MESFSDVVAATWNNRLSQFDPNPTAANERQPPEQMPDPTKLHLLADLRVFFWFRARVT
jgi:hypothetical protein